MYVYAPEEKWNLMLSSGKIIFWIYILHTYWDETFDPSPYFHNKDFQFSHFFNIPNLPILFPIPDSLFNFLTLPKMSPGLGTNPIFYPKV